jgi:hypothetical protein
MKRFNDFDPIKGQVILTYLRQGGFPAVAADAAGVPWPIFEAWLRRGEERRAREPLRSFARAVRQAMAQARLLSELSVCKKEPKFWLCNGPGRETLDNPGWTNPVRPRVRPAAKEDPIETCRFLCSWVMEALTPFPDARQKVAELIVSNPPEHAVAQKLAPQATLGGQSGGLLSMWRSLNPSAN